MQAEDILAATHKLEESGMTRSQSEAIANTIIAAVAPLATKADLKSMKDKWLPRRLSRKSIQGSNSYRSGF